MNRPVYVNGFFRHQRVTGPQRYAREIADRLLVGHPEFCELGVAGLAPSGRVADWLELQTWLAWRSRAGTLLSLTTRAPVAHRRQVVVIQDLLVLQHPEWFARGFARAQARLLKHQLAHAQAFVTSSQPVLEEIRARVDLDREIVLAPPSVSSTFVAADDSDPAVTEALGIADKAGFFLAVGSLEPRKNLERLIAAHRLLPPSLTAEYPLVIVGAPGKSFAATGVQADATIRLAGYLSDRELSALYARATAYVSVSLAEGFGIPIVEAMAHGTPVVLSDIPAHRWVAAGQGTYVAPESPESIAEGLERAVDRPGPVVYPELARRFDWDHSAGLIGDLLLRVSA